MDMEKQKLTAYLREIEHLLQKRFDDVQAKQKRGELFNIFTILKLSRNEVRLHSAFLAELLNPMGCHGLGDTFLRAFLQELSEWGIENNIDPSSVVVDIEYPINGGFISEDGNNGGRLDIYLHDSNNKAIIIENKIDACDQDKQLLRYWNFGTTQHSSGNFSILYLTKDGKGATDASLGESSDMNKKSKTEVKYHCISYSRTIKHWLLRCIELSAERTLIRSTIRQYINNIEIITAMSSENDQLVPTLVNPENVETTLSILELFSSIGIQIREKFINSIKTYAEQKGLIVTVDEHLVHLADEQYIHCHLPNSSIKNELLIGIEKYTYGAYYEIRTKEPCSSQFQPLWNEGVSKNTPFGSGYFTTDGKNDCRWWRWDEIATWRAMADGSFLAFIKTNVINDDSINALKLLENQ